MSNVAKLMLALVVLALAVPAVANPLTEPDAAGPNSGPQTTSMRGDDGEIWLILYIDLDGSGTFNDRREFLAARLLQPAQR